MIPHDLLMRLAEPGAVLALTGIPTVCVVRRDGEDWRRTWTGPRVMANWAARLGCLDAGPAGRRVATYHINEAGRRLARKHRSQVDALRAEVRELREAVAGMELLLRDALGASQPDWSTSDLRRQERRLLKELQQANGRAVAFDYLADRLGVNRSVLHAHVCHLRQKQPHLRIETVRGIGYKLEMAH